MKDAVRTFLARLLERQVHRLITRHHLRVIAVAGSVGKTGTRAAIAIVLRAKFRVQAINHPGYNSELGLPLSVFGLSAPALLYNPVAWAWRLLRIETIIHRRYPYDLLVLELGTDHPGEIERYLRYLSPDMGVITAVTPEHTQNFPGGLDQVASEELSLARASHAVVANYDDIAPQYRHKYLEDHKDHHYYGLDSSLEYSFKIKHSDIAAGTTGDILKNKRVQLKDLGLSIYGKHSLYPPLAAFAVADLLGLTSDQIKAGLEQIRPIPGRMNPLTGIKDTLLIDDSYNSSPAAAIAALSALAGVHAKRRIALLGNMNELGAASPDYHKQVGAAAASLDLLVTLGLDANEHLGPAAIHAGLDPTKWQATDSPYAAGRYLKLHLKPGDVVLVKGSQNRVYTEEVVKMLLEHPRDVRRLVRQTPLWLRRKHKQFPDFRS